MGDRNIHIEKAGYTPVYEREVEIVERKGLGHPDTLIDGIMESISRELSKAYIKDFGKILHHNVDKGQICGGGTHVEFGGGQFLKPIYVLLSGRATQNVDGIRIPSQHIALKAAREYLRNIRNLDYESDVIVDSRIAEGSPDLVELFLRGPKIPFANDTSFGVGYAPFSDAERLALEIERYFNSEDFKKSNPSVGEDIKVMAMRKKDKIELTIAVAMVSRHIADMDSYIREKSRLREAAYTLAQGITDKEVEINVNAADDEKNGSVYITLSGTSAEMGDDGSVGRGNRANGLITPGRSMTLEATAGKNPVNHVGKVYSILANEIARQIVEEQTDVREATVKLLSEIGKPIDQPHVASVELVSDSYDAVRDKVQYIVDKNLEEITELTIKIVHGKVRVFY